jgi:hypothetical protein
MLGLQSMASARVILSGIEMIHMIRKGQAKYASIYHCRSLSSLTSIQRQTSSDVPGPLRSIAKFATDPPSVVDNVNIGAIGMVPLELLLSSP